MDFSPVSFIEGLISVLEKLSEKIWPGLDTIKNMAWSGYNKKSVSWITCYRSYQCSNNGFYPCYYADVFYLHRVISPYFNKIYKKSE